MDQPPPQRTAAAALTYNPLSDQAPQLIEETRIRKTQDARVPTREDRDPIRLLQQRDLDGAIPEELYQVVAEILAFIYQAHKEYQSAR